MEEVLEMSFLLKVENKFYSEKEVVARINDFKMMVRSKIDLETTEGAWSIRYYGEELLGTAYWDEITLAIDSIAGNLLTMQSHTISEFLPLQSIWIRLTPLESTLLYRLESAHNSRTLSIKKGLPAKLFYQKFFAMYMRMVKIMANLGSSSYLIMQEEWARSVPNTVKTLGIESDEILQIARKSMIEMANELGQQFLPLKKEAVLHQQSRGNTAADAHTYTMGDGEWVVHNSCPVLYRVEGIPNQRFAIDSAGNVTMVAGPEVKMHHRLYVGFDPDHALYYLELKLEEGLPGAHIKYFEVE